MKKLVAFVLAMVLLLTTCSFSLAEDAAEKTFTVWHKNLSWCLEESPEDMEAWDEIEAATGVKFDWVSIDEAVWGEQVGLAIAGNMLPDAFWHSVGTGTISQYIGQNIFLPLEDLIDEYMPNLTAVLASRPDYAALTTAADGHIYSFPYIEEIEGLTTTPGSFYINKTWLDKLGLEMPTTVDEFTAVLKAFRDAGDLNENGLDDEIPYSVNFVGAYDAFTSQNTLFYFLGCFGEAGSYGENYPYTKIKDDKVFFVADTDAYRKTLEYFHELYTEGLLDMNGFSSGDVAPYMNAEDAVVGALGIWEVEAYSLADEYVAIPRLTGENGKGGYLLNRSELCDAAMFTITTACEDPVTLCKLIDMFYDPVMSVYMNDGMGYYISDDLQLTRQFQVDYANSTIGDTKYRVAYKGTEYDDVLSGYYRWSTVPGPGPCAYLSEYYGTVMNLQQTLNRLLDDQETYGKSELIAEGYTGTPPYSLTEDDSLTYSMIQPEIANIIKSFMVSSVIDGIDDTTWQDYLSQLEFAGLQDMLDALNNSYVAYNAVKQEFLAKAADSDKSPVEMMIEEAIARMAQVPSDMSLYLDILGK